MVISAEFLLKRSELTDLGIEIGPYPTGNTFDPQ